MSETITSDRRELLKQVQEADFLALDLQLYMNTHPTCEKTLDLYVKTVNDAKELRKKFELKYGPLTASAAPDSTPWQWSKNPWTWDKERS